MTGYGPLSTAGSDSGPQNRIRKYEEKHTDSLWIHMFLGFPDPDPDPLVRGMDPDPAPDPSIIMLK